MPKFYLSLGSNIEPGANLAEAISRLRAIGEIQEISSVWESHAVGSAGPNFLNVCVSLRADLQEDALKKTVLLPIEQAMGRVRSHDKNAPRPIDIDVLMQDRRPLNLQRWNYAFVILPMSELLPDFVHPATHRPLAEIAKSTQEKIWIVRRTGILGTAKEQAGN